MGYRGKVAEQEQARRLRAEGHTMLEIADQLGVSKSSVSLWTRDVDFVPRAPLRQYQSGKRSEHPFHVAKVRQIQELDADGLARLGVLDEHAFLAAGAALYAGEGSKSEGEVRFANTDPRIMRFFCEWLRYFFDIDEDRLRVRLYLHQGLDLEAAVQFWEKITGITAERFRTPYRAVADASIRRTKHVHGCAVMSYSCTRTHRAIMGLVRALLSSNRLPGW